MGLVDAEIIIDCFERIEKKKEIDERVRFSVQGEKRSLSPINTTETGEKRSGRTEKAPTVRGPSVHPSVLRRKNVNPRLMRRRKERKRADTK